MMLYVKPLKIARSRCPEMIFAANLRPNDTARDKYEMNDACGQATGHPVHRAEALLKGTHYLAYGGGSNQPRASTIKIYNKH
jgi:hypothetical protein